MKSVNASATSQVQMPESVSMSDFISGILVGIAQQNKDMFIRNKNTRFRDIEITITVKERNNGTCGT